MRSLSFCLRLILAMTALVAVFSMFMIAIEWGSGSPDLNITVVRILGRAGLLSALVVAVALAVCAIFRPW
jgi:hypothetical protein